MLASRCFEGAEVREENATQRAIRGVSERLKFDSLTSDNIQTRIIFSYQRLAARRSNSTAAEIASRLSSFHTKREYHFRNNCFASFRVQRVHISGMMSCQAVHTRTGNCTLVYISQIQTLRTQHSSHLRLMLPELSLERDVLSGSEQHGDGSGW